MISLVRNIKKHLRKLHGKTDRELATDFDIYPRSSLYKFCNYIGQHLRIYILTPHVEVVGNCADEIYNGFLKARREGRKLHIVWPYRIPGVLKYRLPNVEVVNLESSYRAYAYNSPVTIVSRVLITAYFVFFRAVSLMRSMLFGVHLNNVYRNPIVGVPTLWNPEFVKEFSWDIVDSYDWAKQWEEPVPIWLHEHKRKKAELIREQMGLPRDAWYVCLHVREGGFHGDGNKYPERNADIANYIEGIKEITAMGGWVVRLGDASMTRLPEMDNVIDYPFTKFKSKLMDVYLISECRLYIGMISGIYSVAELLQRPLLTTNLNNWVSVYPPKENDFAILRKVYSRSRGRFLSIKEWMEEPWEAISWSHPIGEDYIFYENSSGEIRSAINYSLKHGNKNRSCLQQQFSEHRLACGKNLLDQVLFSENDVQDYYKKNVHDFDLTERYRIAAHLVSARGRIPESFLERYWDPQ